MRLNELLRGAGTDAEFAGVARTPKGMSSLTYDAELVGIDDETAVIVKLATPGTVPRANRDVLRQADIIVALAHADLSVPVPRVILRDPGSPPALPPLFVMTRLAGDGIDPTWPDDPDLPPDMVRERTLAMARALARLHAVPVEHVLEDEPALSLVDELERWTAVFGTLDLGLGDLPALLLERLMRSVPEPLPPVLNHGDYRFGNVLFVGTEVSAMIDWEIAAKQDPRFDLANLTLYHGPDSLLKLRETAYSSDASEVVAEYERAAGRAIADLGWFDGALRYKSAAALGLLVKNSRKRDETNALLDRVARALPGFLRQAIAKMEA